MVGGLTAIGAAIYSIGIPKDSVIQYEADIKADSFIVMAHGTADEVAHAKKILGTAKPARLVVHIHAKPMETVDQLIKEQQDRFDQITTP